MSASCQKRYVSREYDLRMSKYFKCPTNLLERVYQQQVVLENIFIRGLTIYGTIRVNNCSFDKRVFVRSTIDQWRTSSVKNAYYSMHYSNNNTDLFLFKLTISKEKLFLLSSQNSSMSISFVIGYHANGQEFWDNNYSRNYSLEIVESTHKETASILNQLSSKKSILNDETLHRQIAQDYHAMSNTSQLSGNLCGLRNLDGTCYMNSILQSLSFTSLLTNYFFSNEYTKDIDMKNGSITKGIIGNEYLNLLYLLCCGKYTVITPAPFKQIIGHIQNAYLENQQQDAHEFLLVLLDYLHKDFNRINPTEILNEKDNLIDQINNDSIITDLFYGTYQSTTTCVECLHVSRSFEPFACLTLPILSINQCTLEECLTHLNVEEDLMGDSRWFCPSCQCLCNAKKRLGIYKLPKVLIIQLKRFQIDFDMNWIKNDTLVLYPEDNLDLHEHCSSQPSLYTLYSVVNHNGSLNDGHYTTFSRDISSNHQQWFEYDDEIIQYLLTDQLFLNSKAYLLFYTIKQTSEPMTMRF